jgi:hypothetical protein
MLYKRLVVRVTGKFKSEIPIFVSSSTGPPLDEDEEDRDELDDYDDDDENDDD